MSRRSASIKAALILILLALVSGSVLAGGPVFWEVSKQQEIVKGDARGVSIADNGTIMLAPAFTLVYDTKEAYIWSSAADKAGNIYLGTGHEGRIFKVEPGGAGRLIYDAGELDVTALATDSQGNVYAGTSPDGKIYKITPDGRQSVLYDPPDKYIWSLLVDQAGSTLYAGTGDKGIIYKIDQAGKASTLADTTENNIVSLAFDRSGNVIAGTDPSGLVIRVSSDGKTFALFDSPMQEIHELAVATDGSIFALGINPQGGAAAKPATSGSSTSTSVSSEGVITISADEVDPQQLINSVSDPSASQSRTRRSSSGSRSAVFRVLPDGGGEDYWSAGDAVGFGLEVLPDGRLLVGTGNKGRVYSVGTDRSSTLLVQSPEDQTSTLISVGDNTYATSSNLGRLYRIGRQPATEGTYVSPVHDTRFAGQWGVINWRGAGSVELQTRSGNTENPDATWSDWSAAYRNASGDQIASPRARFIQWRAVLRSNGRSGAGSSAQASPDAMANLQSVTVAYLPRNQAPVVASVTVLPTGVALQEQPLGVDPSIANSGIDPQVFGVITSIPPRRFFQKGARTITWQASDANNDTLKYRLLYRTLGDKEWHVLAEDLSETYFTIDGNRLPDAAYVFKVQATDSPSNPSEVALTNEEVTDTVEIDNTPPTIKATGPTTSGRMTEVAFEIVDNTSRVVKGEYSVDGDSWRPVFPADGIADSAREIFRVKVTFNTAGEHVIAFRCTDSSSNVGTSKVTVR